MWRSETVRRLGARGGLGLVALAASSLFHPAHAQLPPSVMAAERRDLEEEIDVARRKTDGLERSLRERRPILRARLRSLYKLSQGGYLRLLAGAGSPSEHHIRRDGLRRLVARDLDELSSVRAELRQLERERARRIEREGRLAELSRIAHEKPIPIVDSPTKGFPARPAGLLRPVAGGLIARFGPAHDPVTDVEISHDGIRLTAARGEPVRAIASGRVRSAGVLPDLGLAVVIDHGGGWTSLVARLAGARVASGATVAAGATIGEAAGPSVELQLIHAGTWIDPAPWLAPPAAR